LVAIGSESANLECIVAATSRQIGANMLPTEHRDFCAYADSFHLKDSALANLLIVRELHRKRLGDLKPLYFKEVATIGSARITAHQTSVAAKAAFIAHAAAHGLKMGPAAGIIFRAELTERWLGKSI
jgi:hypothetical protein